MKIIQYITSLAATTLCLFGTAEAQQMSFTDHSLVSGSDLQAGASYRFTNVTSGTDAVVTIDGMTNVILKDIDTKSESSITDAGWRPTMVGTGAATDVHYVDFSILFYANGTNQQTAPGQFTTTIFGNDFINEPSGFSMEFIQVEGATWVIEASDIFDSTNNDYLESDSKLSQLALWNFENKPGYTLRYGWQGGDNSERTFNAMMLDVSGFSERLNEAFNFNLTQNLTLDTSITPVPEPSSILLFCLSIFPLALRRHRP